MTQGIRVPFPAPADPDFNEGQVKHDFSIVTSVTLFSWLAPRGKK